MKSWAKWILIAGLLLALVAGIWQALRKRQEHQQAVEQIAKNTTQTRVLELQERDVLVLQEVSLEQNLVISGTLRAVNSAFVKARVSGELQALTVREGDWVTAGQVLARIDTSEYQSRFNQAQRQADSAKAQVDIAQRQFNNNQALVQRGFISQTALDNSQANLDAAQANYQAAVAATEVVAKALQDTELKAPISGSVSQRLAQPGEPVSVDARVLEIVDLRQMELEAAFTPADSLLLRVGQRAQIDIEKDAQLSSTALERRVGATVVRINPSAQAGSRNVVAYLRLDASDDRQTKALALRQGLFAQGHLHVQQVQTLAVPLLAVRTDKPEPYVQVVENGAVIHRHVQMGARMQKDQDTWVELLGVPAQTQVLQGALGLVPEGTKVKIVPASSTPSVTQPAA